MKSRIYIAGCGGMLGEAFKVEFNQSFQLKCSDIDVNAPWISFLDFRDFDAYRDDVLRFKPNYLFHLGALTDLEFCEQNTTEAYSTNTMAVENAVFIANELDIPLLYISTAGIFDGNKDVYDDWDTPNPLGHYARSKYAGEVFVRENVQRHLICRAGWMMGGGPQKDKKFIQKIMSQLRDGKRELFIVNDKFGTPTYTYDFAKNVNYLIKSGRWGLYNMVCEGVTSRLEVVTELLKILNLHNEVSIKEVSSEFFKDQYFAARPLSERLENRKLQICNLNYMRDWRVSLRKYIESDYVGYLD